MTTLLLGLCALSAPPQSTAQTAAAPIPTVAVSAAAPAIQRTLQEWRSSVTEALKGQAGAKAAEQPAAVMRLVQLYRELTAAGTLPSGEDKRLKTILRTRLLRVRDEATQDVQSRLARVEAAEERAKRLGQPDLPAKVKDDKGVLAQWRDVLAQVAPRAAGGNGRGGNVMDDDGQELVDLIQAVITPDFWDTNGGPGSIVYFRGLKVMVVRGTTQSHEEVAALLGALRRAGN